MKSRILVGTALPERFDEKASVIVSEVSQVKNSLIVVLSCPEYSFFKNRINMPKE